MTYSVGTVEAPEVKNYSSGGVHTVNNTEADTKKFTGKPKLEFNKDNNRREDQKLRKKKSKSL